MKNVLSILIMLSFSIYSYAQFSPKDVMARVEVQDAPFDNTKFNGTTIIGSSIEVNDGELSRKIYSNAQLTEWDDMREYADQDYYCLFQIDNPVHPNNYLLISLNQAGDYGTGILASANPDGNITDNIDAYVTSGCEHGCAIIMDYRIVANGDVIISRIVPTSSTSIPLGDLKDFHGYRQDTTYRLDQNGKFEIVDIVRFVPQQYTTQVLSARDYHVWNGHEVIAEQ